MIYADIATHFVPAAKFSGIVPRLSEGEAVNSVLDDVAESYREAVEPLLKIVPPAAATRRPPKKDKKEKNSKP